MEMDAESGDDAAAGGASGKDADVQVTGDNRQGDSGDNVDDDDDDDDDDGKMRRHQFDKNIYTFSAAAGRALKEQTSNIKNLV